MKSLACGTAFFLLAAVATAAAQDASITDKDLTVTFDSASRTVQVSHKEAGTILDGLTIRARLADQKEIDSRTAAATASRGNDGSELAVTVGGKVTLRMRVKDGVVQARVEGDFVEARLTARALGGPQGAAPGGAEAIPAILQDQAKDDHGVLVTTLGPAEVRGAAGLFDPQRDLAISLESAGQARWVRKEGWRVESAVTEPGTILALKVRPHYYRDGLGIKYYAPRPKVAGWPTAPVVAMTWYGIEGWKNRPAQTHEWLRPQIDWVAQHLKPYVGDNLVFQLDDNYSQNDDKYMRSLSDYIRSKGLVPGIWFTPFTVAPKAEGQAHGDWFLRDKNGKLIATFGGVNWGGNFTLNATNPQAVEAWFGMWWKKASQAWNFDFFKIDGEPEVADAYRRSANGGGDEGYRKGLRIGREIVGPDKFINGCWGTPVEGIGIMNGSRIGGDTGNDPHAINVILEWNFLNNVAWWCDPDAAANLFKATVERTRLNAQARVLTGQQFLTDDLWTKVPPAIARVWQQSFPMLDIFPANLYPIRDWKKYDLFDLKIRKPWAQWDVVGLFNYDGKPVEKDLDLTRLAIGGRDVHVFDYWRSAYLGKFAPDAKLPMSLAAWEGRVFSVVPAAADDRPVLISTSRHVSQGGLDLEAFDGSPKGDGWTVKGTSSHLVKDDPYQLVFAPGKFVAADATVSAGKIGSIRREAGVVRVTVLPDGATRADWSVTFVPVKGPLLDVVPAEVDLLAGATRQIEIRNAGTAAGRFKIRSGDARLHASPQEGDLTAGAKARIALTADTAGMDLASIATAGLAVECEGSQTPASEVTVKIHAPLPENVARKAKASASSFWPAGPQGAYGPEKAVDGDRSTRWNSREGDKDGCWIELTWDKPVQFDRVTIDECMDFGPRIQSWKLLAGTTELKEIAQGKEMGADHVVSLPRVVEATRLRLLIEKASVVPTIWEIEVQQIKQGK